MRKFRSINKKIFLATCILLILSSVIMYSIIAYLLPKTFSKYKDYKNDYILNELKAECRNIDVDKSDEIFNKFIKENTTDYFIEGTILFNKDGKSVRTPYTKDKYMDIVYEWSFSEPLREKDFINSFLFTVGKSDKCNFSRLYSFDGVVKRTTFYEKDLTFKNGETYHFYVFVSNDSMNEVSKVLYETGIYVIFFIVIVSIIVSRGYSRFITKPLLEISTKADKMANDLDLNVRCNVHRTDEINTIDENLNSLAKKLDVSFTEIKDANRTLEDTIKQEQEDEENINDFFKTGSEKLKKPINEVINILNTLKENPDEDDKLDDALVKVDEIETIVKNILDTARKNCRK